MRSTSALLLLGAVACGNRAPGPAMITLSPATPTTDDDLVATIDDDAFEPEGQAVTYRFDWYKDGELAMPDAGDTLPANLTRKGETWRVEVTASDGKLAGDPIGAEVTVVNSPPTVSVSITPQTPYSDDDLVAVADAQDPDGDTVSLSWSWTRDGQATGLAVDTVPASQTVRWQAWVVTVTPFDGTVEGTPTSAGVEVENAPPEIFEVTLSPDPAYAGEEPTAEVDVTDADGDAITLSYAWTVDGGVVQMGASNTLDPALFAKHQTISVEVTPSDSYDQGTPVSSDEVEVHNSTPAMDRVALDPSALTTATDVTCVPVGLADADGDPLTVSTTWYVDARLAGSASTLASTEFERGDTVSCVVVAHDGEAEGPTGTSPVATVQNALPVVASVTLSPSAPAAGDTLSASVSGLHDDDGDAVTAAYAWTVDGALVSTATTLSSVNFAKHQDVILTITPNDGIEDGLPVASAVATVVNTPPSYTALATSPADAALGGSLTALPTGWADPDGDAAGYLYTWTVDGVAAGSAATLDLAPHSRGAEVELTVTAWDGDDTGTVLGLGPLTLQSLLTAADASSKLLGDISELAGSGVTLTADITGDTFPDCIVGSPAMVVSGGVRGGVNLITHPTAASIDMDTGVLLSGQTAGHLAGQAVVAAGDTNADGRPDLLVGAPGESTYASGAGAAYLLPGPISTSFTLGTSGRSLYGRVASEAAGSALAGGGDLDADGYDDLAVGAPSAGNGAVYLIFGPVTTSGYLDSQDAVIGGAASGDQCGFALAQVGDTDGDGLDDLLLGAPGADGTGTDRGAAYLLAGADVADGDAASLALGTLGGEADWDFAGYSVAGPGDVDGDGYQDLLVGSRWQDAGGSGSGAVYLVLSPFTGALDLGSADAVLQGSAASENAGTSLAGAGDLDGDGADDFLVGAPGRAGVGASAGAVYVIAGLPTGTQGLGEAALARIDAATTGDKLGQAVTGGVDVDLDGTPDVLIGAPYEDAGGTSAGAAYLFSGADL